MIQLKTDGCFRRVFLVGAFAIKVPNWTSAHFFARGWVSNQHEVSLYKTRGGGFWDERLCPIRGAFFGGLIVVAKRAREMTSQEFLNYYGGDTMPKHQDVECKKSSYGWIDGKIVMVDYGGVPKVGHCRSLPSPKIHTTKPKSKKSKNSNVLLIR